MKKVLSL